MTPEEQARLDHAKGMTALAHCPCPYCKELRRLNGETVPVPLAPSPAPPVNAALLAAAKKVQWGGGYTCCPCCGRAKPNGHRGDCELAVAIAAAEAKQPK